MVGLYISKICNQVTTSFTIALILFYKIMTPNFFKPMPQGHDYKRLSHFMVKFEDQKTKVLTTHLVKETNLFFW
jgi:hypothetical protein